MQAVRARPGSPTYAEDLVTLTTELDAAQDYEAGLGALLEEIDVAESNLDAAAEYESTTLLEASNGRTLTDAALAEFRSLLGL